MKPQHVSRVINAFQRAVEAKAFQGTIPVFSEDEEEQEELNRYHMIIDYNYIKARNKLERLLERV